MKTSDYECFESLSEGPVWTVSEGGDGRLDREVAIKSLRSDRQGGTRIDGAYWDGMRALASTPREGIVGVYDIDPERGWVVMQRADSDLAAGDYAKPMKASAVTRLLQQVAGGLEQLHALGRVHGGVHRANVLIDSSGRAMLNASPGFPVGGTTAPPSPAQRHVAPELLNQEAFGEPGPASDLYCLGFLGLELLLGKRFDSLVAGVGSAGWIGWHASPASQLPALEDRLGEASPELVRVLTKLTAKNPKERYSSAREVAIDLARCEGVATGEPVAMPTEQPSLVSRVSDGAAWSRLIESPGLLAKAACALVATCLITTLITANALPESGSFQVLAIDPSGNPVRGVVVIDSENLGGTNERIEAAAQHYRYQVRAEGYRPGSGSFTLVGGDHLDVSVRMDPLPPPPVQAVEPTRLTITAQPPEAVLSVRNAMGETLGQETGTLSLDRVEPGAYRIVAQCEGHEPYDEAITVYAGRGEQFEPITLRRVDFDLNIQSNPPGATVYVDGSLVGVTQKGRAVSAKVNAGKRQVVLRMDGYRLVRQTVEIADQGQYLEPLLEPIPDPTLRHEVVLRSEPSGAEVVLPGKPPVQTPHRLRLTPGFHEVTVRRPGSAAVRSRIEVRGPKDIFFWRLPNTPAAGQEALASADQPPAAGVPAL